VTVAIVADSGSDLTPAQLLETGIRQVPLSVSFGPRAYLSPDELAPDVFWEKVRAPGSPFPHTAAASVGQYKQAFEGAFADGHDAIVCVCLSEALSATIQHARMARELLPDRPIFVLDSRLASMALGAMALRGAALAASGMSAEEICRRLSTLRESLGLYVALDTLDYLRKGGRISHARAAIGGLLSIKPIITLEDGWVVVADRPRTRSKATERILELMTATPVTELHLLYTPPADIDAFRGAVLARMPGPAPKVVTSQVMGPVIGSHVGPGAYGGILVRDVRSA
jgi:DegV family protein with EDD domain